MYNSGGSAFLTLSSHRIDNANLQSRGDPHNAQSRNSQIQPDTVTYAADWAPLVSWPISCLLEAQSYFNAKPDFKTDWNIPLMSGRVPHKCLNGTEEEFYHNRSERATDWQLNGLITG